MSDTTTALNTLAESLKSELTSEEHKATADVLFSIAGNVIRMLELIEQHLAKIANPLLKVE